MFNAILTGFKDGLDQPYEFNVGMSFDSPVRQWVYDKASLQGQRFARVKDVWNA